MRADRPGAAAEAVGEATALREQVVLAPFTTLGLGGPCRRFAEAGSDAEAVARIREADARGDPLLILGGGSNLVIADEGFPGTVVRIATTGIRRRGVPAPAGGGRETGPAGTGTVDVTVAAGEGWDGVVASCVAEGLAGLECLSGIPGQAGATPVQNVGAYGQEVAQTLTTVRAWDRQRAEVVDLAAADCGFGYRDSMFRRRRLDAGGGAAPTGAPGRFVVLGVTFRLTPSRLSVPVRYRELAAALDVAEGGRAPLEEARAAVLGLRRGKGMVLDPADPDTRSAGSFFTNPVLSEAQFASLERAVAATGGPVRVPHFAAGDGSVKVPAAWLIERAGFGKGYPGGAGPRISSKHTLALVNPGGATTASLLALARQIRDGVRATFGVELVSEPDLVGVSL